MPLFRITVPDAYARFLGGSRVVVDAGNANDARQVAARLGVPFAVTQAQPTDEQGATGLPRVEDPVQRRASPRLPVSPTSTQVAQAGQQAGASPVGEGEVAAPTGQPSVQVQPSGRDITSEAGGTPTVQPQGPLTTFDTLVTSIRQAVNTSGSRQQAEQLLSQIIQQARASGFGETDISALVQQGNALASSRFPAAPQEEIPAPDGDILGPAAGGAGGALAGTPTGGPGLQQFLDQLGPNAIREITDPETGIVIGYELDPAIEAALGLFELEQGGTLERERLANLLEQQRLQSNPFGRSADQDADLRLALERGGLSVDDFFRLQAERAASELSQTQAQFNPFSFSTEQALDLQQSLARGGLTPQERLAEIQAAQQAQNAANQLNFLSNPSALGVAVGSGGAVGPFALNAAQQTSQSTPFGNTAGGGGPFLSLGNLRGAPANPTLNTLRNRSDEEMDFLFGQSASRGVTPSSFLRQAASRTPFGASRGSQVVPL